MIFTTPTTPQEINDNILIFCKKISSQKPVFINITPHENVETKSCFPNVKKYVDQHKECTAQLGWIIWGEAQQILVAEFHSVVKKSDGSFLDITPPPDKEKSILFLPDNNVCYENNMTPCFFSFVSLTNEIEIYIREMHFQYLLHEKMGNMLKQANNGLLPEGLVNVEMDKAKLAPLAYKCLNTKLEDLDINII